MQRKIIAMTMLLAASGAVSAQSPPPVAIAPPAIRSPEIAADRRVTFRIAARNAAAVSVAIEGSPSRPMQKDDKGVWSLTTEPLEPDFYPVLYLLHGFSDDASAWTAVGMANIIIDTLIARGAARPMIVAMPLGYGAPEIVHASPRSEAITDKNVDLFSDMMISEIIPQVERSYRAATDRGSRAIAGLSMGGGESLFVGLNHLDRFSAIGAFSSGLREGFERRFPHLTSSANAQLSTLWIACGTSDALFEVNRKFRDWLTTKQIRLTAVDTPGAHTWMVWRRNLAAFAPLLFR